MRQFTVGERVRWVHANPNPEPDQWVGEITAVIPNDSKSLDFTEYIVAFKVGTLRLYGTQIEPVLISGSWPGSEPDKPRIES